MFKFQKHHIPITSSEVREAESHIWELWGESQSAAKSPWELLALSVGWWGEGGRCVLWETSLALPKGSEREHSDGRFSSLSWPLGNSLLPWQRPPFSWLGHHLWQRLLHLPYKEPSSMRVRARSFLFTTMPQSLVGCQVLFLIHL